HLVHKKHDVVIGFDVRTDKFDEGADSSDLNRSYSFITYGGFIQYIYNFDEKTTIEAGLRIDYNNRYKVFPLPHVALRRNWNSFFSTRLNVGMGYKLPTIFQDESEEARYLNVLPIADSVKAELSLGGTIDWKVKLPNLNGLSVNIHQVYFLTHIFRPLLPQSFSDTGCHLLDCEQINYTNARGYMRTGGVETGISFGYRGAAFSVTYSYTDNNRRINGVKSIAPLTSKHIVAFLAGYEIKHFSIGVDIYYYSPVKLSDGRVGHSIWEVGMNVQYAFKYILLFANFENIADIRQTSFGPTVYPNPTYAHPRFSEIYAPLEGRLFNVGFKIHLAAFAKNSKRDDGIEKLRGKDD
ncbi:MAG TPA: TonB-dependent receptor, partial [Chitinophagales bacterium]|nr:TonB-dependent receptor [Chitinophagales bacterium]